MTTPGQLIRVVSEAIHCVASVVSGFMAMMNYMSIADRNMRDALSATEEAEPNHSTM